MALLVQIFLVSMAVSLVEPFGGYPPILRVQPQQIHIAYGKTPQEMMIMWSQLDQTEKNVVLYGVNGHLTQTKLGRSSNFTDGGSQHSTQYISRVLLEDLIPGEVYTYVVGNEYEFSDEHVFQAMPAGQDWSPRLAVYGDLGNVNAQSLARLETEAYAGMYDAILHVGDFAYDMRDLQGTVGDEFMRQLEPLAAQLPYMTCPGNHEEAYNFSHYRYRFEMPGDDRKTYYSFNMGPVHFVSVSTELVFYRNYGIEQVYKQYDWLKQDLEEANKPESRALRPWVVVFGHRPMYCSDTGGGDCTENESVIRNGIPSLGIKGFEDVLYDNGVDLSIWAHEHSYERLWPMYNKTVMNGSYDQPYTNPRAPVQIITGSAGCRENVSHFDNKPPAWSAFRSSDYGYTRMHVLNKTHINFEQVSDDKGGQIIDQFTIIKTYHGPYTKPGTVRAHKPLKQLLRKWFSVYQWSQELD